MQRFHYEIYFGEKNYLLKFPGNLKEQQMKNIRLSYSNSPVCEYIGSQIYSLLGFEVHNTVLGERNGKTVVACEDFLNTGDILYEFDKIKVTFEPHFLDSSGNETNGVGVDLYEIMMTIQEHPFLKGIEGVAQHFWNMFVADAFIGNADRNNSNWGIVVQSDGSRKIAPVYDDGNCLNSKWDDEKMKEVMEDVQKLEAESYKARRCIFQLEGKKVNPYHIIEKAEYSECSAAVRNIVPGIEKVLPQIKELIQDIPVLSVTQKYFFMTILQKRYEDIFRPVYKRLAEAQ